MRSGHTGLRIEYTLFIAEAIFLADEVLVMTPRPGRLARVINVPFEHPRHIGLMRSSEFNDLVFAVREILGADQ